MNRAREDLLAGAGLAQQHHRRIGAGDLLDRAAHLQHVRIAREELAERAGRRSCLQATVLRLQLVQPEGAVDHEREQLALEGLGAEIVRPQADGLRAFAWSLPGEHDDLGVRRRAQDLLQQAHSLGWFVGCGGRPRSMVTTGGDAAGPARAPLRGCRPTPAHTARMPSASA